METEIELLVRAAKYIESEYVTSMWNEDEINGARMLIIYLMSTSGA